MRGHLPDALIVTCEHRDHLGESLQDRVLATLRRQEQVDGPQLLTELLLRPCAQVIGQHLQRDAGGQEGDALLENHPEQLADLLLDVALTAGLLSRRRVRVVGAGPMSTPETSAAVKESRKSTSSRAMCCRSPRDRPL